MCEGDGRRGRYGSGRCCRSAGQVRGFVQPWLLLLLLDKPSHGYELMDRLAGVGEMPDPDPGMLYRTLRLMEEEGMVASTWDTEGNGPARRLYQVTGEGIDFLHAWAATIRQTRDSLEQFLAGYGARFPDRAER
jgi:PadR family transcriptional regulator, regulatory protein PadR